MVSKPTRRQQQLLLQGDSAGTQADDLMGSDGGATAAQGSGSLGGSAEGLGAEGGEPMVPSGVTHYPRAQSTHEQLIADSKLFFTALIDLLQYLGLALKVPKIGGQEVDLHRLYKEVTRLGGLESVMARKLFVTVCEPFNFPASFTNKSFVMRKLYCNVLHHFEQLYFHHNECCPLVPVPVSEHHQAQRSQRAGSPSVKRTSTASRSKSTPSKGACGTPRNNVIANNSGTTTSGAGGGTGGGAIDAAAAGVFALGGKSHVGNLLNHPGNGSPMHSPSGKRKQSDSTSSPLNHHGLHLTHHMGGKAQTCAPHPLSISNPGGLGGLGGPVVSTGHVPPPLGATSAAMAPLPNLIPPPGSLSPFSSFPASAPPNLPMGFKPLMVATKAGRKNPGASSTAGNNTTTGAGNGNAAGLGTNPPEMGALPHASPTTSCTSGTPQMAPPVLAPPGLEAGTEFPCRITAVYDNFYIVSMHVPGLPSPMLGQLMIALPPNMSIAPNVLPHQLIYEPRGAGAGTGGAGGGGGGSKKGKGGSSGERRNVGQQQGGAPMYMPHGTAMPRLGGFMPHGGAATLHGPMLHGLPMATLPGGLPLHGADVSTAGMHPAHMSMPPDGHHMMRGGHMVPGGLPLHTPFPPQHHNSNSSQQQRCAPPPTIDVDDLASLDAAFPDDLIAFEHLTRDWEPYPPPIDTGTFDLGLPTPNGMPGATHHMSIPDVGVVVDGDATAAVTAQYSPTAHREVAKKLRLRSNGGYAVVAEHSWPPAGLAGSALRSGHHAQQLLVGGGHHAHNGGGTPTALLDSHPTGADPPEFLGVVLGPDLRGDATGVAVASIANSDKDGGLGHLNSAKQQGLSGAEEQGKGELHGLQGSGSVAVVAVPDGSVDPLGADGAPGGHLGNRSAGPGPAGRLQGDATAPRTASPHDSALPAMAETGSPPAAPPSAFACFLMTFCNEAPQHDAARPVAEVAADLWETMSNEHKAPFQQAARQLAMNAACAQPPGAHGQLVSQTLQSLPSMSAHMSGLMLSTPRAAGAKSGHLTPTQAPTPTQQQQQQQHAMVAQLLFPAVM